MADLHWNDGGDDEGDGPGSLTPVIDKEKQALKPPSMYAIVVLNDDFTTMEFVIDVLVRHFGKVEEEAYQVMMDVHEKGKGIAGIYTKDIAETKVAVVRDEAQSDGHPLLLDLEEQAGD